MKTNKQSTTYAIILIILFTFTNCTAWPAISAILFQSKAGGGGIIPLIPGSSEPQATSTLTATGTEAGVVIGFSSVSSNNLETSPNVTIPVTISTAIDATVSYTVTGTATGGGVDYTLANGTLTFTAGGTTSQNITFTVVNDAIKETNETVIITLSSPSTGATLGTNTVHTYTITDDDSAVIEFSSVSSAGGEGTNSVLIPVTISTSGTATVDYSVTGGTATGSGTDYTLASGTLTFTESGSTTQNITITVNDDALYELDETIILTLSNASGANLGTNTIHTYTITNEDGMPTVAFSATSSNGSESVTAPTITVTLSGQSSLATTVDYAVSGASSASGGSDYTLASGTLTFPAGTTTLSQTIPLAIVNDTNTEMNETVIVLLSNAIGATLGTSSHIYTIDDNDPPSIAFGTNVSTGSESISSVSIPVSLSSAYAGTVSVDYAVTGGSATSGADFTLASGTLLFTPGVSSQNITVSISDDVLFESNETIVVSLTNPTSGSGLGGITSHTYTIVDDDTPSIAFNTMASSGNESVTAVTIPVNISTTANATVNYSVTGGSATGGGTDYTLAAGTLTFTSGGATTQNISVTVANDAVNEADETIVITLSGQTAGINLGVNTVHTYTITNDDTAPTVAFDATTSAGLESVTAVTIPVSLTGNVTNQTVTVGYSVTGGTATAAGTDFTLAAGTLTFNPGTTTLNIPVTVVNDTINETNETIVVTLATPTIASLGTNTVHTYTINDNDTAPTVAFTATTSSGTEATTAVTIPVTLTGSVTSQAVTVDYSVTGGTATAGGTDFTLAAGTLTFVAGTTSQNISVTVVNDTINEANETIVITLANPTISALGANTVHTYTITNDDTAPTVAFGATTSTGNESTAGVTIPVSLTGNTTSQTITVDYALTGTATGGGVDYTLAAGTLTFNPGTTTQNISATIVNDGANEANETIIITLSNPSVATLGTNTVHTYTILDDDTPSIAFNATTSSGSEATTSVTIPVSISITATSSVNYSVTGGTATDGGVDYTFASGTLNFTNGGATTQNISITVNNDTLFENDETIIITLASPTNANLGANTAHTYTITNNDTAPTVAFSVTTSNGAESVASPTMAVTLSGASGLTTTVDYAVTGGTASGSGTDFTLAAGTLTFAAGVTSQNITLAIVNDVTTEVDETIIVTLSNPINSTLGTNTAHTYTINDNDPPTVAFSVTTSNGSEATTPVTIPVTLSAAYGQTVTVGYSVTGGNATSGGTDFTLASGTLTFAAGVTSQDISIAVVNDTRDETNETIQVTLASPTNSTLGTNTVHTYTIDDNDAAPTVAFTTTTSNGAESVASPTMAVTLSGASGLTTTVDYAVTGGTASGSGTDFTLAAGTLTFAAGVTSQNITLAIVNDVTTEVDETIIVTLSNPTNSTLGTNTAHTYTINDNDPPTVAFSATTSNGSEATTPVTIPVTLSAAYGQTVTVGYSVTGGSATSGGTDFTLASGTLTFTAGVTSQDISIAVVNDTSTELDETIVVTLASPTNASLGTNTAHTHTINDNDPPTVAFSAITSNGSEAATPVTIPVTLSSAYSQAVTVGYSVTGGSATSGGTDFTLASGTLTFAAGVTSQDISIAVVNDTLSESNETIVVTLASPTVATLGANTTHTYTINDNDTPNVNFTTASSSGSEATTTVNIPVTLSFSSANTVTVDYSVTGGTATSGGTDFTLASGTLTYTAGVTSQDVSITVNNDALDEAGETIVITISNSSNAVIGATSAHTYTINDDDPTPTVAFSATTSNGSEATTPVTIPVTLSATSGQTVTVDYSVTGGTATAGGTDFTLAAGTLTFTPGVTSQDISIAVVNDGNTEVDETIVVTLASPTNATLGTNTAHTYTINDNDPPTVAFSSTTSSGSEATTPVTIPVTLSSAYSQTVTVGYSVTGGSATSGGTDFILASGTLTFTAGVTSQDISIAVVNDTVTELNETIVVTLASPTVATLGTNTTHTYTINDNDPPTVAFSATTSNASESTTSVTIPVILSSAYANTVTVNYSVTGGTATGSGTDYTLAAGTLTFTSGVTSQDISFTVLNDTLSEANETIIVTLASPTVATLGTNTVHTYTIENDDTAPTVGFAATASSSGDESSTSRNVEVTLSAASGQTVTVTVTDTTGVGAGIAVSGTDYTAIGSPVTVTFNPGVTSQNVSILVLQDLDFEGNETLQLTLSAPSNATLGGTTGHTFTITDDDAGILSAETMDADNDGKIDHYKLTFSEAVNDSSFPGYLLNSAGTAQTDWLVAGYTGVVLVHGTAAPEADTANDTVIYLRFNEGGSSDTDAKPNLTTTATPALVAASAKTIGRVYTATVVEADRAKPVLLSATAQIATTLITLTFSEPVWTAAGMPACGAGGDLTAGDFTYNDVSGNSASSISSMGADPCGSDLVVNVNSNTALMPSDNTDTIVAIAGIFDAANNNGNPTVRTIVATGGPTITNIDLYDTNKNGKIDQAKVTFSINMNDATIDDADASRFTIGGNAAVKVDTGTSGTGVIVSPNNDTATANDSIVTIFTDDFTLAGTDLKSLSFTQNAGRWMGNGVELATAAVLTSVTNDKAPPVILTAVAAENTTASSTVDSDDTLVITFSEVTNKPTIDSGNIASIFSLSNSHVWGNITSATWNAPGDVLTITFAGTGSPTLAVGDYITILGTIADTATSPNTSVNIQSVNPISGNFSVQAPSISSASSTSATTIRVVFSENVNNTEATTLGNYKIALSSAVTGTCSNNSNFSSAANLTFSAIVKVDDKTYDFTTSSQTNGTSYTVLADKNNIHHKDYPTYTLTCPNNANFIGQEKLRVTSVTCSSLTSLVVTFSKPVNSGMNVAGSAECNTTAECNQRYVIKGIVSGTEVGSMTQAKILDGTVCGGQAANSSKVCITHTLNQNGSIYTLVAANATDSDGFNDSAWSAIQSTAENLQASPKDRASFTGCGTTPHNFIDGPVVTDPFGDGTTFGYLNKYQNKIYIGPNQKGNGATRFEPDGSSPENLTFELLKDTTVNPGSATNRVSSSTASAPFASIGYTGCNPNDATATGCGPNNENGRGLFATGTFSGTEYLFITGASANNNDYLYYTPDLDSVLNFNYMDASEVFDNYNSTCNVNWASGVTQNQVTESIHIFNGKIYWSVPGDGTNRPFAVTIGTLTNEINCDDTNNAYLNMRYMSGVGRLHATKPAQADIMGGVFNSFNDRLYFANSGSISYSKVSSPVCIEGSTYSAGVCEQTGGIVRSINNNPAGCTSAGGCPDWVDITPSSVDYKKYFTIGLEAITDLIPAQKPIPNMETYKNNFYFIRNACTQALWDDGSATGGDSNNGCAFSSSCGTTNKNDKVCPLGAEIPQLWKCVPTLSGSATECDADDWSLVAQNGTTGKTNFGDANNTKVTMLSANGDYLYVGFDNATTGIEVWRTNVANPSSEGDFSQIGGDGFGAGTAITEVYSHVSLQSGSIYYLYLSVGKNSIPVRVHRQQNEAVAMLDSETVSFLLAYINQEVNGRYATGLLVIILLISLYFIFRNYYRRESIE